MMQVTVRKNGKEYQFWGLRSVSVEKGCVLLFVQETGNISAQCLGITKGKVVSFFVCNLDYSHTSEEAKSITW